MTGTVQRTKDAEGRPVLRLTGVFELDGVDRLAAWLTEAVAPGPPLEVDLGRVERLGAGAATVLVDHLRRAGALPQFIGARPDVAAILDLYTADNRCAARVARPSRDPFLVQVGEATLELGGTLRALLTFVAEASGALWAAIRRPASVAWDSVARQIERHGADGLPIVTVIGALMGLITAFQAAIQLSKFGADTFVADLVGLSLTRELAPLMTAIVVAGRSGAAIAAKLGTMKVSEEIDALRMLGLCPHRFLVFPRVLALVVVLPLLTLVADVVGVLAGAAVTTAVLDIGLRQFVNSIQAAVVPADVLGGLVKAAVFVGLIGGLASERGLAARGLAARGGAEGVGRATTSAVVAILFWLVLADALFAVLFDLWGVF